MSQPIGKFVLVQLRYNYRPYPTPGQRIALSRAFGCARVVFNDGLRARQEAHAAGLGHIPNGTLMNQVTTKAKQSPERSWLSEVSSVVLQQAVGDLNTAYKNFFDSMTGKRKGPKVLLLNSDRARTIVSRFGSPGTPVSPSRLG